MVFYIFFFILTQCLPHMASTNSSITDTKETYILEINSNGQTSIDAFIFMDDIFKRGKPFQSLTSLNFNSRLNVTITIEHKDSKIEVAFGTMHKVFQKVQTQKFKIKLKNPVPEAKPDTKANPVLSLQIHTKGSNTVIPFNVLCLNTISCSFKNLKNSSENLSSKHQLLMLLVFVPLLFV
ncbi:hypothetical protein TcasGA2_TC031796 [Tribolium castaneum]|uniref:Uncharacterized protein n=2 Tax=Tribolium castaneum TaxID=7070 RepID=A0A139WAD9_TRICA|nr:hypothetical protein TcasGA2_TC031796 [Tribolium castaneum]